MLLYVILRQNNKIKNDSLAIWNKISTFALDLVKNRIGL